MLNHIDIPLVLLGFGVGGEGVSLCLEPLHDVLPLLLLADQRGREVDLVGVVDALCLRDGFVDLQFGDGVGEGEDLLEVQVFLAELGVSELLQVFHEIDLILKVDLHNLIPECLDQAKRDQHRRDLFLRNNEIPDPLGEIQGEVVEEESDEPLKQPQFIHYVDLLQLLIHLRNLLLQDDPEQFAIKLIKREAVLVQPYREDAVVYHHLYQ